MDNTRIRRDLLALLEQIEPEAVDLAAAVRSYARERVVHGLLKPRSVEASRRALRQLTERWGGLDVAATDWRREAAELYADEGRSAWRRIEMLRAVLRHAQQKGWRSEPHGLDDVLKRVQYLPREAVYTEQQIADFLAACERLDRDDEPGAVSCRAREVLRVLAFTGCRLREISELRFDEIGPGYLRLRDSKTGPRHVPISGAAQLVLGRQRITSGWVFPGRFVTRAIGATTVQVAFRAARAAAGLRDGVIHTLRHSFCSIAVRNGVPIPALQKITGHRAAYLTLRYVHMAKRDAELACAVVANAIAGGAR